MRSTPAINRFLLGNGIRIGQNPAISPDLCLDPVGLERAVRDALPQLKGLARAKDVERGGLEPVLGILLDHTAISFGWAWFFSEKTDRVRRW